MHYPAVQGILIRLHDAAGAFVCASSSTAPAAVFGKGWYEVHFFNHRAFIVESFSREGLQAVEKVPFPIVCAFYVRTEINPLDTAAWASFSMSYVLRRGAHAEKILSFPLFSFLLLSWEDEEEHRDLVYSQHHFPCIYNIQILYWVLGYATCCPIAWNSNFSTPARRNYY